MTVESLVRQDEPNPTDPSSPGFEAAVADLTQGRTVVVEMDDRVVLVLAARTASATEAAFCIRHSSGFLEVVLPAPVCDRLLIPEAGAFDGHANRAVRQCVAVDAVGGTTGISAADRALTARTLGEPRTTHLDITRPGHVIVQKIDDHPATSSLAHAAVAMCYRATGSAAAVIAELVSPIDPRRMADRHDAVQFARTQGLEVICA
jgi:3,4-dihydroxy 2-butanone 4-phosphate synthase/GTP cyclohydrolase II